MRTYFKGMAYLWGFGLTVSGIMTLVTR